jgi:hypothetical protein
MNDGHEGHFSILPADAPGLDLAAISRIGNST